MTDPKATVVPWLLAAGLALLWLGAMASGGPSASWDGSALQALHRDERDAVAGLAWTITWLGDWIVLVPLALAGAGLLAWRGYWRRAAALLAATLLVRVLVALQKQWLARPRPDVEHWMVEHSHSFPSAHAANSAVTFLALAILLSGSRPALVAAIVCAAMVGTSRVVLGVHWPSDVIAGWAFGALAAVPLWPLRPVRDPPRMVPGDGHF